MTKQANKDPRASRRAVLKAGVVFGTVLLGGSLVASVRTRGYDVDEATRNSLVALTPWQFVVVQHLARRIAAPDRVDDPTIPTPDRVGVASFVDRYVAKMPGAMRRDLLRAFAYVEHLAPLAIGFSSRFTRLRAEEQDRVLASLESSAVMLLRGAFDGIKSLVFMGYYRDPRTWKIAGYAGPRVGRPDAGWWQ